jgi:prevent-host-death family protein
VKSVNIHEAKTHLSRLLAKVAAGEEVVIARAGHPVAKLVPLPDRTGRRVAGLDVGKIRIRKDFDEPLPKSLRRFFEE